MTVDFTGRALRTFGAGILVFTTGGLVTAEQLTLQDYVAESISSSPRVLEQVHIFRQTKQDKTIARSGWLPSLDLTARSDKIDGEAPTVVASQGVQANDYDSEWAELALTQNIFKGFDTKHGIRQADARIRAALYHVYDTADNIALDAVRAYLEVLKQHRLLQLAQENVDAHEETLRKISRRSTSGVGRRSQLEQTQGRLAKARAGLVAQKNNLQDALTEAHQLLGRYLEPGMLGEPAMPAHPGVELDAYIEQALAAHPALKVAHYNIDAARHDRNRSKSKYYPQLDLRLAQEAGQDLNGIPGDTEETSVTLTLTYNFFNGGADRAENRKKISAVHEQQQYAARVRRQAINALRLSWMTDQSLAEQQDLLRQYVIQSQKTLVSYQEEFFIGQRDLIDLLDAQNELNSAQNSYTQAYFDALLARYRILEASGVLLDGLGLNPTVGEDDFAVARVQVHGKDRMPLDWDKDVDKKRDDADHCDNSRVAAAVNSYGCELPVGAVSADDSMPPMAVDDAFTVGQGGVLVIEPETLLANDSSAHGEGLRISAFTQPEKGLLERNELDQMVYRAPEDFVGIDSFTYSVNSAGGSNFARVSVSVVPESSIDFSKTYYVRYNFNRAELTAYSSNIAKRIIDALLANPEISVQIEAHTDSVGSNAYNSSLSVRRAKATRQMLINAGISSDRITAVGRGEADPLADNGTKEGRAINRRGEFSFSGSIPR